MSSVEISISFQSCKALFETPCILQPLRWLVLKLLVNVGVNYFNINLNTVKLKV